MLRRVVVRGSSGSGKTTFAAALAATLGAPHVELDALYHLADWTPRPDADLRQVVATATSGDRWVVDGNYAVVQDDLVAKADAVVWLDLPRSVVMRRVLWRTLSRGLLRQELWNGNRESLTSLLRRDPEDNIVAWAWTTWERRHAEAVAASSGSVPDHVTVIRLTSPSGVATFLAAVSPEAP